MTAPDLGLIRRRLVDQVGQHCGAKGYPYAPAKIATTPCVFIGSLERTVATMDGAVDLACKLYFFTRAGGDHHLAELDGAVHGESSVVAAIDDDPTLGLDGVSVVCGQAGDYSLHEWGDAQFWGSMTELTLML